MQTAEVIRFRSRAVIVGQGRCLYHPTVQWFLFGSPAMFNDLFFYGLRDGAIMNSLRRAGL